MCEQSTVQAVFSGARLSSASARLRWLSMEREQGDGAGGGPSMMDGAAESTEGQCCSSNPGYALRHQPSVVAFWHRGKKILNNAAVIIDLSHKADIHERLLRRSRLHAATY